MAVNYNLRVRAFGESSDAQRALRDLRKEAKGLGSDFDAVGRTMSMIKPSGMITAFGFVAQALSAASSGAIGLVSAIAPASGAIAALPQAASMAAQGLGVFHLAMTGVMAAVGGLDTKLNPKKLALLTPPARAFALQLQAMKAPIVTLQRSLQSQMFGGFTLGIEAARKGLGPLLAQLPRTAAAIGQIAHNAGLLIASKGFGADLGKIAATNTRLIGQAGGAGLHLADALRQVTIAAQPMITWMGNGLASFARFADAEATAGRESGRLTAFFGETRKAMSSLGALGAALVGTLLDIGHAAKPLGDSMLSGLTRAAQGMHAWTSSLQGQTSLTKYFTAAQPAITQLGLLVRDLATDFLKLGAGTGVSSFFEQIRTKMLPALFSLVQTTTQSMGPVFVSALTNIVTLFAQIASASGPLRIFVSVIGDAAGAVSHLLSTHPMLRSLVVDFLALAGAVKALSFLKAVATGNALVGFLSKLELVYISAAGAETTFTAATIASAVATRAAAAGSALLAVAMANPVLAGVVIVGGLVAAGVAIYKFASGTKSAGDKAEEAARKIHDLGNAMNQLISANTDAKSAQLGLVSAEIQAIQAHKALAAATKSGRTDTLAYRQAQLDAKQADLAVIQAREQVNAATQAANKANSDAAHQARDLNTAIGTEVDKHNVLTATLAKQTAQWKATGGGESDFRVQMQATQRALKDNDSALASNEGKLQALAGGLQGVATTGDGAASSLKDFKTAIDQIPASKTFTLNVGQTGSIRVPGGGTGTPFPSLGKPKAKGGLITGEGTGTSDSIPIMSSNGEFVSTAEAVRRNGPALEAGNRGAQLIALPGYATGGMVGHEAHKRPKGHKVNPFAKGDNAWHLLETHWKQKLGQEKHDTANEKPAQRKIALSNFYHREWSAFTRFLAHPGAKLSLSTKDAVKVAIASALAQDGAKAAPKTAYDVYQAKLAGWAPGDADTDIALAQASATEDTSDDIAALTRKRGDLTSHLNDLTGWYNANRKKLDPTQQGEVGQQNAQLTTDLASTNTPLSGVTAGTSSLYAGGTGSGGSSSALTDAQNAQLQTQLDNANATAAAAQHEVGVFQGLGDVGSGGGTPLPSVASQYSQPPIQIHIAQSTLVPSDPRSLTQIEQATRKGAQYSGVRQRLYDPVRGKTVG